MKVRMAEEKDYLQLAEMKWLQIYCLFNQCFYKKGISKQAYRHRIVIFY